MSHSSQLSFSLFPGSYQSAQHMAIWAQIAKKIPQKNSKSSSPAHPCAWQASPQSCSRLQGDGCHTPAPQRTYTNGIKSYISVMKTYIDGLSEVVACFPCHPMWPPVLSFSKYRLVVFVRPRFRGQRSVFAVKMKLVFWCEGWPLLI